MEATSPKNAARNHRIRSSGCRRRYPALQDQRTCLLELIPPSGANQVPGPSHGQTSVQTNGSVIGQEVEGVIDGTFHDGYLISMNVGGMTLKGMVYESGTTVPNPAPEEQTVPGQNTNDDVQTETQGHEMDQVLDVRGRGKGVKIEPDTGV